ncbi:MAG: DoxX family protein [Bergeyella sp.]|nr:DoxX family protein [Bergeyella sp.]
MNTVLRFFLATVFIVSGLVKAVDVVGFSFKLEEYFSPSVFNLPFLENYSLPLSVFVVLTETFLGLMLLFGRNIHFTLKALIVLCIFFGFLTFYSAYYDKVTDCGCFGDAIKLTPWQSFYKNVILLLFLIILHKAYNEKKDNKESKGLSRFLFYLMSFASIVIMLYGLITEPIIDFRDYKIGTDLVKEKQKLSENPSRYKVFYTLKNSETKKEITIDQDEYIKKEVYWKENSPWKILDDKTEVRLTKKGHTSEISKFIIEDKEGQNITLEVLSAPRAVLVFTYNPKSADKKILLATEKKLATLKNTYVLGVAPFPNTFRKIKQGNMDATSIKTIARSNPFILVLKKGKIMDKQPGKIYINTEKRTSK